ncbi:hypothetical protein MKW94_020778 [Papaver nudicaule]|uniref:Peptidase A1 domain-containing protein n=1 Tax=Papaver nudicaule TaxID=74823 RepID=A0AA41VWG7_PAPNU|nr:hypothetical protein [Papaver nudicaule]
MASSFPSSCTLKYLFTLLLVFSMYIQNARNCNAFQTFGFEVHHRFSEQVKAIMGGDNLPEIGSREYYAAIAHRDKIFRGRALADDDDSKLLTFSNDQTAHIASLGSLHYVNVTLGTPSVSFLVALDTGTNFTELNLNVYSINSSSSSKAVSCNSNLCDQRQKGCSDLSSQCPYKVEYNEDITSSGILVEDVLRLNTDNHKPKDIETRITFGCGQVQTGFYLDGAASNGLFGLGIGETSLPSILSSKGLVADSFSMCFGFDGVERISFGDIGSSDHVETPFNFRQERPRYNITVTHLGVGGNLSDLNVSAIFYSGAEITYLSDPAYTALCDTFDSQILQARSSETHIYEYCYDNSTFVCIEFLIPNITLIMKGRSQFNVYNPMVPIITDGMITAYCLGVLKASNGNFIGHNFMTGHHIVFDRVKYVLGWKASNCTDKIPRNPTSVNGGTPKNGTRDTTTSTISTKKNKALTTTLVSVGSSLLLFAVIICCIIWKKRKSREGK